MAIRATCPTCSDSVPATPLASLPAHGDCPAVGPVEVQFKVPGRVRVLERRLAEEQNRTELAMQTLQAERDETKQLVDQLRAEPNTLRQHILDIDAHATPYADLPDDPGYVGVYLVTAGALHRALGKIGHSAPKCQAEAERDQVRAVLVEILGKFYERGHPGEPCRRTSWIREQTLERWHAVLTTTEATPR